MKFDKEPILKGGESDKKENEVDPKKVKDAFVEMMEKFIGSEQTKEITAEVEQTSESALHAIKKPKSETGIESLAKARLKELVEESYSEYKVAELEDFVDRIIAKFRSEVGENSRLNLDDITLEGFTRVSIDEV